jgi:hypothetical protein
MIDLMNCNQVCAGELGPPQAFSACHRDRRAVLICKRVVRSLSLRFVARTMEAAWVSPAPCPGVRQHIRPPILGRGFLRKYHGRCSAASRACSIAVTRTATSGRPGLSLMKFGSGFGIIKRRPEAAERTPRRDDPRPCGSGRMADIKASPATPGGRGPRMWPSVTGSNASRWR